MWTDVDNDRCGTLPFVFDDDFGFDRYVEYALDVPMYFVYRCAAIDLSPTIAQAGPCHSFG